MHGDDATGQLPENANSIELLGSVVGAFWGSQVSTSQVAWSDAFVPVGDGKGSESNSSEMIISSINHDGQQIPGADISGSKNIACQIGMRKGQTCSVIQNSIGAQEKSQGTTDGVQLPVNSEVVAYSTGKDPKQLALDKTLGFDPIRQHRHYCTWIVSTSSGAQVGNKTICFRASERVFSSFYKLSSPFLRD